MSYRALVLSQVDFAFASIGDLAEDLTLSPKLVSNYDFATHTTVKDESSDITIKAIIEVVNKKDNSGESHHLTALIKASDLSDPTIYTKAIYKDVNYTIINDWKNDGYLITLKLLRS